MVSICSNSKETQFSLSTEYYKYIYIVGWAIFSNVDAVLSFSFYYVKRAFIFIKWNIRIIFYIINIQDVV